MGQIFKSSYPIGTSDHLVASSCLICLGVTWFFPFLLASQFLTWIGNSPLSHRAFLFLFPVLHPCGESPPFNFTWQYNFCGLALGDLSTYGSATSGQWLSLQVLFEKLPGLIIPGTNLQCSPLAKHNWQRFHFTIRKLSNWLLELYLLFVESASQPGHGILLTLNWFSIWPRAGKLNLKVFYV